MGSKSRIRVERVVGSWGALGSPRKIKFSLGDSLFWPLQGPPVLGATMRIPLGDDEKVCFQNDSDKIFKSGLAYTMVRSWGGAYLAYLHRINTRRHTGAKAYPRCSLRLFAIGARFRRSRCGVGVVASRFWRSRCGVGVVAN